MKADNPRIAILAAEFNPAFLAPMIDAARDELGRLGLRQAGEVVRVSGSFEVPLLADALLARDDVDGLVVLGYLEKGETLHGEVIGQAVFRALIDLQLRYKKPAGLGIIGPGATLEQAEVRKEPASRSAVRAVAASLARLGELGK